VTNNVVTALESGEPDVELILLGGHVRPDPVERTVVGPFATDALRRVFATKAFIGVEGISPRAGLTTPVASEAEIAALMIEQTRGEVVVVADSSKLGVVADFAIAPLERVNRLVTDDGIGGSQLAELSGVEVTVASAVRSPS
jgi:DeoR family fructose operon transcriptional repressor